MYAMLSLDLDSGTTSKQRKDFYEYLKKEKWFKLPKVTTTWYASFVSKVTEESIISETKTDVKNAARYAGVTSFDAVVHVGENKPTAF